MLPVGYSQLKVIFSKLMKDIMHGSGEMKLIATRMEIDQ